MSSTDSYTLHPVDHMPRHMTSSSALTKEHRASQRISQHLRMSPARSPTSIPSSPTSVHSSSSAIFERDIEPLSPPSGSPQPHPHPHSHTHPQNPHRIPRSKTTEQLEHSVPSVLDSAAAILASIGPEDEHQSDQIAVVSPASIIPNSSAFGSGFASPIGSFRSRSPSPTIGSLAGAAANQNHRGSLLLNIPPPAPVSPPVVSASPPTEPASAVSPVRVRPTITTNTTIKANTDGSPSAPPSVITPTSAYFTTASGSDPNSPVTTTLEHPSSPLPTPRASSSSPPPIPYLLPSGSSSPHDISIAPLPLPLPTPTSPQTPHPHSYSTHQQQQPLSPHSRSQPTPSHPASQHKRLSFISYSDLLASSPISTLPLSQLTTSASSIEPPPHIPCVSGINVGFHPFLGAAGAGVGAGSPSPSLRGFGGAGSAAGGSTAGGSVNGVAGIMDEGGEWEREGLGRGLEERLDWVRG